MRCQEIQGFADLYLDGEFDERESAAFEEHVGSCEACRNVVRARRAFLAAFRQKLAAARMPADLKEQLTRQVHAAVKARHGARSLALPMAVAASALVLVLGAAGYLRFLTPPGDVSDMMDESVAVHEASLPLTLEWAAVEKVRDFVKEHMDGDDAALPLPEDGGTRLQGVALARIGSSKAVLFKYLHNGRAVSVVRMPRSPLPIDRARTSKAFPIREVYRGARHGHAVSVYEDPVYRTAVVADVPENDMGSLVPQSL